MKPFALKTHEKTNAALRPLISEEIKNVSGGIWASTSDGVNTQIWTGQPGQPAQDDGNEWDE